MKYIALLHKEGTQWVATVPDLNNTSSYGDTIEEAAKNTQGACELYMEDILDKPKQSTIDDIEFLHDVEPNTYYFRVDV